MVEVNCFTCQSIKSLNRRTPLVRTRMSSGGLFTREVMRFESIVSSVIELGVAVDDGGGGSRAVLVRLCGVWRLGTYLTSISPDEACLTVRSIAETMSSWAA